MLTLYDINHVKLQGLTAYKNLKIVQEINVEDTLSFLFPISDPKHSLLQEECYIQTKTNEYVIKEVNYTDDNWTEYICKVNIEELKGKGISHFESIEQTCTAAINLLLATTGWTIGSCDVTKLRTVRKSNCSVYVVIKEIQNVYNCEMTFDSLTKEIHIYQSLGSDKGSYVAEQLNLKALTLQRNSYQYVTRLIPIGKDGLDVSSVNGGLNYVSNNQYSNKVIMEFWEDNRYTVAQDLLDDAIVRLAYLSKPYRSYQAEIIDLAAKSETYTLLEYGLGDTITLLAKSKETKEKQRIIQLTQYPDEFERNTCQIANKQLSLDDLNVRFVETSEVVESVTTSDGLVDGGKIDAVDWGLIDNISIGSTDIQDAAIIEAKIGDLAVTTGKIQLLAVGTAQIADASISNAKIDRISAERLIVETADIEALAVQTAQIDDLAVTTAKIEDAAVDSLKVADAAITNAKIDRLSAEKIIVETGDIRDLAVTNAQIADLAVTAAKIAMATIKGANIENATIDTANIVLGAITNALIGVAAVNTAQIANGSITDAKIVDLTASKLTAGTIDAGVITVINLIAENITAGFLNGERIGDATLINRMIGEGAIKNPNIFAETITGDKLVVDAITTREIAAGAVTANEILAGSITSDQIAAGAIKAVNLAADAILANMITTGVLSSVNGRISFDLSNELFTLGEHLLDSSIGTLKFTSSQRDELLDYLFQRPGGDMVNVKVAGTLETTEAISWGACQAECRTTVDNEGVDFVF